MELKFCGDTGKIGRWCFRLYEMEFVVFHHDETKNQSSDALSRLPAPGDYCMPIDGASQVSLVVSPPNKDDKVCIQATDLTEY